MLGKRQALVSLVLLLVVVATAILAPSASAQQPVPTVSPKQVPPTATAVPPTVAPKQVPPTATNIPSTATKVPPTATKVPPTATKVPTLPLVKAPRSGGPPGGGFYSGHTVMNAGSSSTAVNVTVYNSANTSTYTLSNTVTAGASWTFLSDNPGFSPNIPAGFQGSAVLTAGQPLKAVVNITNLLGPSGGIAGGTAAEQYDGWDGGKVDTTVAFPLAKNAFGPKTTAFYLQNAGASAAPFYAQFKMGPGTAGPFTTYNYTSPSINPGQMAVVYAGDAGAPTSTIGSLTVTSTQQIAGSFLEYETTTSPALILQAANGVPPADYDTTLYFPTFKKGFGGRSTGLNVQNVTGSPISVTMTYYGTGGSCAGNSYAATPVNVNPGALAVFLDPATVPSPCIGSAKAVATGNIAATANESFVPCSSGCVQASTTYVAFPAKVATGHILAPMYKQQFGCKATGLMIQNINPSSAATATAVFNVSGTTYTLNNISINPNNSVILLDVSTTIPAGSSWSGGTALPNSSLASVSVTANTNIVGIANEAVMTTPACSATLQNKKNYEAFNVTP